MPSRQLRYALVLMVVLQAASARAGRLSEVQSSTSQGRTEASATDAAPQTVQDFIAANTLQKDGKSPFHLVMSFQVFDLNGKPSEQGKIDYWWGGPSDADLSITAPSFGTIHDVRLDRMPSDSARRTLYLANELLDGMRFPASSLGSTKGVLVTKKLQIRTSTLECIDSPPVPLSHAGYKQNSVCTDETSGTVRLITGQNYALTRNRIGLFAGTHVALDLAVLWDNKTAITGHVDKLERYTPKEAAVPTSAPERDETTKAPQKPYVRLAGGVIAGSKVAGQQPHYPETARLLRISGTVVLMAVITPEGQISSLFPVASPDPSLTQAAVDAVKTWSYRPYLLNGTPVEVNTSIIVNFNINGR